jgi:hypothetical protein
MRTIRAVEMVRQSTRVFAAMTSLVSVMSISGYTQAVTSWPAAVLCSVIAFSSIRAEAQSDLSVLPIFVDYDAPPPPQLDQLAAEADAVVVVRIDAQRFKSVDDPSSGRKRDVTQYEARIREILKGHSQLASVDGTLTITRRGGQRIENGKVIRSAERGFEDFRQNSEYVLFLTWNQHTNEFDIRYGPDGSYELPTDGSVRSLGRSDLAKKQHGKTRTAFLQDLRKASGR